MLAPRFLATIGLVSLLGFLQYQLWLGHGGLPQLKTYRQQLAEQSAANDKARQRNEQLASEVHDLQEGLMMVEEIARYELGMIKPNEVFVQVAPLQSSTSATPAR